MCVAVPWKLTLDDWEKVQLKLWDFNSESALYFAKTGMLLFILSKFRFGSLFRVFSFLNPVSVALAMSANDAGP